MSVRDSCVVRLRQGDIGPDMRLRNFDSACDYYLDSSVTFSGDVVIEAGTVVISDAGQFAAFEDGSLTAIGTASEPIVFRAEDSQPGNWFGVQARGLSSLRMAHVEVRDGGAEAGQTALVDIAALRVNGGVEQVASDVSLVDVTVSGSAGDGLEISQGLNITEFARNVFVGNAGAGISLTTDALSSLDVESDYVGVGNPNGIPVVAVERLTLSGDDTFTVPNLRAPIQFGSSELGAISASGNAVLQFNPGTEISLPSGTGIRIDNQAQFFSVGTASEPVTVSSLPGTTWSGIRLVSTREVVIEQTVLGRSAGLGAQFPGAIAVNAFPNVQLRDITVETTADWGVYCTRPFATLSIADVSVFGAAEGAVHPDCGAF